MTVAAVGIAGTGSTSPGTSISARVRSCASLLSVAKRVDTPRGRRKIS